MKAMYFFIAPLRSVLFGYLRYWLPHGASGLWLGNVCLLRTVCIWYTADSESGSSFGPTGFSLHNVEHWIINLVNSPSLGEVYHVMQYKICVRYF